MKFNPVGPSDETLGDGGTSGVAWVDGVRTTWAAEGLDEFGFRTKHQIPSSTADVTEMVLDDRVKLTDLLLLETLGGILVSEAKVDDLRGFLDESCLAPVRVSLSYEKDKPNFPRNDYSFYAFGVQSLLSEPSMNWSSTRFSILESSRFYMRDPDMCPPFSETDVQLKDLTDYHSKRKQIGRRAIFPLKLVFDSIKVPHMFDLGGARYFFSESFLDKVKSEQITGLRVGGRKVEVVTS